MIRPHDKVSWLEGSHRYWGFVQAIINRQACLTAMIEHKGKHIELPLDRVKRDNWQADLQEMFEFTGAELIHEAKVDYADYCDEGESFEKWFPEIAWIDKTKRYRCNAQLEYIEEI